MAKDNPSLVCPACGIQRKVFEEYNYNLSPFRKIILDMDLHAIMVHFPQTIAVLIPVCGVLSLITNAAAGIKFLYSIEVMTYILPFTVLVAIGSGIFDGKIRFKKINTPALKKKIILGIMLLCITCIMAYLNYSNDIKSALFRIMGLSILSLMIQVLLARTGIRLMFAWLPG